MTLRIKFSKYGVMKFIGHLDVMRYFQKAVRRSGLDVAYSKGFSPHQIMSFASPLGVGVTSDGEYMDLDFNSDVVPAEVVERLNEVMADGFFITAAAIQKEPGPNERKDTSMALVAAADYKVTVKAMDMLMMEHKVPAKSRLEALFQDFMKQEQINVMKKTKKSEQELDIRPHLYAFGFSEADFSSELQCSVEEVQAGTTHAERFDNTCSVYLRLAAGSAINIKPELVMEAFFHYFGITCRDFSLQIHRLELYKAVTDSSQKQEVSVFVPLYQA